MEAHSLLITFLAQLGVVSLTLTSWSFVRDRARKRSRVARNVVAGILFGGTAALVMEMPGELINGFRFDLRIVPLAVVGLVSGPLGAAVAAIVASGFRLWVGGAGAGFGVLTVWLAFVLSATGGVLVRRGFNGASHVVIFSALNTGLGLLILFLLPSAVRARLLEDNTHLVLLLLNFTGTLIATFFVHLDVQRLKNARLNALHKQLVSALPDALSVKDLNGRFLVANEATARLMGANDGASMVGKTDFDYYKTEEAALFWKQEQTFLDNPTPIVLEQQFERESRTVWLSTIKAPYVDETGDVRGIVSHTADVTSRKSMQAELISTQVLLETAMSEMADGLAMFDRDGRLVMWNRRYLELFPYVDERSCHGRTLAQLLTDGVVCGRIRIPRGVPLLTWVQDEVERSQTGLQSDVKLGDGRWVSKSTRSLADGGWVTLYADISDKKAAVMQLERLANMDGLTELANRRVFDRHLEAAFQNARETAGSLSLLMIDVDHFKVYNDTYGHPAGDEVLRSIANVLGSACRSKMDLVARYGGEEFAVILPEASEEIAYDVALRLAEAIRMLEIPHSASSKGRITVSIGLATTKTDVNDCQQLLKSCDEALYAAKTSGRDQVTAASVNVPEPELATALDGKKPGFSGSG